MADEFDGDFTASTGDIFGKRGKGKRNEKQKSKKVRAEGNFSKENDEDVKSKRFKTDKDGNGPKFTTPSDRVVSQVFRGINVAEYVEARALEVSNTIEALNEAAKIEGKRVLQRLPRHMRRRAASYDARRIPRCQRKTAMREVKDNPIKRGKMPSRKHRRRPKNLLDEYNRRKRNHAWLETHIWHAKRFKMVEKWGYKMAEQPCDKGLRSAYRASANGCLLQDISYEGCIEIRGPENKILEAFMQITNKNMGASIAAKKVLAGERTCTVLLFKPGSYPYGAISPVEVMWKPCREVGEQDKEKCAVEVKAKERMLWLWCHPASHDEVVETLKNAFVESGDRDEKMEVDGAKFPTVKDRDVEMDAPDGTPEVDVENLDRLEQKQPEEGVAKFDDTKLLGRDNQELINENVGCKGTNDIGHGTRDEIDVGEDGKSVGNPSIFSGTFKVNKNTVIKSMKLDFVKFRLTGPLSHQILASSLQLHENVETECQSWWQEFYSNGPNAEVLKEAIKAWKMLRDVTSPGQFPPRVVLPLTVLDPRLNIPIKKTWPGKEPGHKTDTNNVNTMELLTNWSESLCDSPIWDQRIRNEVNNTKISEAELNERRSKMLDIGKRLEVGNDTSRIPVLLIQRPGVQNPRSPANHYGCGWDFIAPSGWGMPFLVSFVYRGAHVGGLREDQNIHLESQIPYFPKMFPDTKSGTMFLEKEAFESEEAYNRRPAGKRTNYEKLGICHPFGADWKVIVQEWKNCFQVVMKGLDSRICVDDSFVKGEVGEECSTMERKGTCRDENVTEKNFYVLRERTIIQEMEEVLFYPDARKWSRASLVNSTHLCEKRATLLQRLFQDHPNAIFTVSLHCIGRGDPSDYALISFPNKEDFEKLKAEKKYTGPVEPLHRGPKDAFPTIASTMNIGESFAKSIGLCTRWTIGQVTSGRYSLRTGTGSGLGFVSALGLVACLAAQPSRTDGCVVLLRNPSSQQYRFARINVIV